MGAKRKATQDELEAKYDATLTFEPLSPSQIAGVERAIQDAEVCYEYLLYDTDNMTTLLKKMLKRGRTGLTPYGYYDTKGKFHFTEGED